MSNSITTSIKNKKVQLWARRLHIYISMALLLVVLFFAITGITLNRPHLFVSETPLREQHQIIVPSALFSSEKGTYSPDKTKLLHFLNGQSELSGTPSVMQIFTEIEAGALIEGEISLDYKGPGYNGTVFIDMLTGIAEIETTHYGLIAVLNDLHKGRNSGQVWAWFIDASALLMVIFVLTGVCLLVPKRKSFNTGLKWTAFGSLLALFIFIFAVP
ncbi:peptidase [Psychromonas sp. psych-6C06]|uniref:PepSY-associated TM helix domain-containing protein n=1 Tax=Psychromonas sp. psych-6C06 TaxID=2058089 RepID=UPI000C340CB4|nr:PepSY-associated TM helix domain-containing protein [Psychromonas sp. psych-6C06]PKF63314.1 peptidase [Psychromonas sp. psych-6C06]